MREIKFRAWFDISKQMEYYSNYQLMEQGNELMFSANKYFRKTEGEKIELMQFTGLKDKNSKEIYEGDIVGEEGVYHFLDRECWKESTGNWKIIGQKIKNFTGKEEEKYIAGYELKLVEWKDKSCGFEPFSDSEGNCHHCNGGVNPQNYEVIGNIYENPELLKETK